MNPVKQLPQVLLVLLQACLLIELQLVDDLQSTLFTVFNEFPIACSVAIGLCSVRADDNDNVALPIANE
jgi:hypothetical protein